ncbi:MAG TPA: RES family NAD+ phosphorylase [Candidatus Angelobacter sp.]|nr:RES family NAD+ phosphorylase [Candidatus Angelobacter sp.]
MPALTDLVRPWEGRAFRHIPAESGYDVRDLRFAGRRSSGRWHWQGQPTLYLASTQAVAISEFARHLAVGRGGALLRARRAVYEIGVRIERSVDLRDRRVLAHIGRDDAPACWLDERIARAVATFFRDSLAVQALLVPSVAHLDDADAFNLVCFLENLPGSPRSFLPRARRRTTVDVEPDSDPV